MSKNSASWLLVAPLLLLIVVGFVIPIGVAIKRAFDNPEISMALPRATLVLSDWNGEGMPPEAAFEAVATDMREGLDNRAFGALTRRLNFESTGLRSTLTKTRSGAAELAAPYSESLPALAPAWGKPEIWRLLKLHGSRYTASYVLRALDLRYDDTGAIVAVSPDQAIFRDLFLRTFTISLAVTAITVLLGYPTAWFISTLKGRAATAAMMCVLVPFWISILVRSTAWFILLQREGVVNAVLGGLGLISEPKAIIFTRPAVYIAMVHVLLPFFILPLLSVMSRIKGDYVRAGASLGAKPWQQFLLIYLPLTLPGVTAGGLMVFMLSVGFYITPALVGGIQDQMIGYYIDYFTNNTINQGMAAALSLLLLLFTGLILLVAGRLMPSLNKRKV
ncbi:MAG: ABC transporter permease [Paracoccus sp. (in: a-proteobacteria)]|uniref:ABC transporter permease n=1 Tax=Paracoccus sp. TaxID=267 RepID=UPI0039E69ACF